MVPISCHPLNHFNKHHLLNFLTIQTCVAWFCVHMMWIQVNGEQWLPTIFKMLFLELYKIKKVILNAKKLQLLNWIYCTGSVAIFYFVQIAIAAFVYCYGTAVTVVLQLQMFLNQCLIFTYLEWEYCRMFQCYWKNPLSVNGCVLWTGFLQLQ